MSDEQGRASDYRPPANAEELVKRYAAGERYFADALLPAADLCAVDLAGADLRRANLRGAKLRGASLRQAQLLNAILRDADLQDADLSGASGLQTAELGGSNVCGAKLADEIRIFDGLRNVEEVSKHSSNLFFSLLLACVYAWLTIATTTDALLLTNSTSSPLPVVGAAVPIVAFYLAAPLFLLVLYIYFHLNLQRLWDGLAEMPAVFPDGRSLDKKVYPWLLNGLVWSYFPHLRERRPPLARLQFAISVLVAWWLGPLTVLLFWGRYLRRHDWAGTILLVVVLTASIGAAALFFSLAAATLRGEERETLAWKKAWKTPARYRSTALMIVIGGVFFLFSFGTIYGIRPDFASGSPDSPLTSNVKPADLRLWVPRAFALVGFSPFADLREVDVSIRPPNWTGLKDEEMSSVKRARLRRMNLRYADAYRAFLVGADLNGADLQGAYLFQANLRGADLMWADLREVFLSETDLQGANLQKANLRGADLSEANLRQARMEGAVLDATRLDAADLRGADLTDVVGLTAKQLESARLDEKTRLPAYLNRAGKRN